MTRRRGWSSADAAQAAPAEPEKPKGEWVPKITHPLFNGVAEMARYEQAIARGRREGETLAEFMERVNAEARGIGDRELPMRDRIPGEEG